MQKHLHIIAFNIPYPANYGGVISVFYHLKSLHQLGVKITLHCYEYGREHSPELNKYCERVFYYKRNMSPVGLLNTKPFIVISRNNKSLLNRLLEDGAPILYEGIHTCATLSHPSLKSRLKIVRTHNIEADYYANLANLENNFIKKIYFNSESKKLRKFEEKTLRYADHILAISPNDTAWFQERFDNVHYVPAFHSNQEVDILAGKGDYTLFHGDLSVKDNTNAAFFLIKNIFTKIKTPFIIAGLNPPEALIHEVKKHPHITLKINVSQSEMNDLHFPFIGYEAEIAKRALSRAFLCSQFRNGAKYRHGKPLPCSQYARRFDKGYPRNSVS